MLEITGADIAALNDTDLRTLIGLLCEAEARQHGHSPATVTWGGNQTAKDGGLDVRVDLPAGSNGLGFIPSAATGFQVKKPDMPRGEIIKEMRPSSKTHQEGMLRPVIGELADASGAYIIISSSGSTSDAALRDRRSAMRAALAGHENHGALHTDFYDRNRVASWVREYAGLIPWVRERIGRAIRGWEGFGPWSRPPAGAKLEYLVDDKARVRAGRTGSGDGVAIVEGINLIRDALRSSGHAARLVGLSGVGKTRLAEALFDAKVGVNALDPSTAIFTNMAHMADPSPPVLASDLIAASARAVVIVDNCSAELHRELAAIALGAGSTISVLTIEYDIREDQPEGTDVFVVGTASPSLIETLISQRFPEISQIDRRTVAEFSGGNARIALAIAATIGRGETITGLKDQELFERLFNQRQGSDQSLLRIAQACALVYSFEGERLDGESAELPVLAALSGRSAPDIYEAVAELQRRELVQARGEWRAVLPHAIANRLAALALQNIPRQTIHDKLVVNATPRLRRSFSRRLGYLEGSKEAQTIVAQWLGNGGCLASIADLDEFGQAMLVNVAPIAPEQMLAKLEAEADDPQKIGKLRSRELIRLVRSLAYEAVHFERAVAVLVKLIHGGDSDNAEPSKVLSSLFTIALSGTHAPVELRLRVVRQLLDHPEPAKQKLGIEALKAMMEADAFHSDFDFDFGARSRDYGYFPHNGQATIDWFRKVLAVVETYALGANSVAVEVRAALAEQFRGLWSVGVHEDVERVCASLAALGFWREGWREARTTLVYSADNLAPGDRDRLSALEQRLRPRDLIDQVRGLVLNGSGRAVGVYDLDDEDDGDVQSARACTEANIKEVGAALALDMDAFETLLPELVNGSGKVFELGAALGEYCERPLEVWSKLVAEVVSAERPAVPFLCGFLFALHARDAAMAAQLLEAAATDALMAKLYPRLQTVVPIDDAGLARLHASLHRKAAPISEYTSLAYGRVCDGISGPALKELVLAIARETDGFSVALEILAMRLHAYKADKREPEPEIVEAGNELLSMFVPAGKGPGQHRQIHELESVAKTCLKDAASERVVCEIAVRLRDAAADRFIYAMDYPGLVCQLFAYHPLAVLSALFPTDDELCKQGVALLNDVRRSQKHPLDEVPDETILSWCDSDPGVRYPTIAKVARPFTGNSEIGGLRFTRLVDALLARSPNAGEILQIIISRVNFPSSWSGSLANVLDARLKLLETLDPGPRPDLVHMLDKAKAELARWIESTRRSEAEEARELGGSFE